MATENRYRNQVTRLDTVDDYLNKIMDRYQVKTDYQLAKLLQVQRQTIYRYRAGGASISFDERVSVRVAELLELDPELVLASMQRVRSTIPEAVMAWDRWLKRAWKEASRAGRLAAAAAVGAVALAASPTPADARTLQNQNSGAPGGEYTLCERRRRRLGTMVRQLSQIVIPGRRLAL